MATAASPKRNRTLIYIGLGVLVLLLVFAAIKARRRPRGEEVQVGKVERRTIRETVSASGKIFPETEVKISADVSGEIVELYIKEGDSVRAGQILAKVKPDEYQSALEQGQAALSTTRSQRDVAAANAQSSQAQIQQLEADRIRIQAQLETARSAYQRTDELFRQGVISKAEQENSLSALRTAESALAAAEASLQSLRSSLTGARANVKAAESSISGSQARLRELQTNLQKTVITAPVSGIVSKLNVERGERVVGTLQMSGTEILRIANFNSMEVQVDVSENDILKVALGDEADIEVDAYLGRKFKGKVSEIANSASNISSLTGAASALNTDQVTNFVVKIRVDPASYADLMKNGQQYPFRPGMSASVDIFTKTAENIPAVPIIAVTAREKDGSDTLKTKEPATLEEIVYVVVGDTVAVRPVEIGIQDNDFIEIISGLQEGETVVTGPYTAIARKLKSGARIRIEEENKDNKSKKSDAGVEID